MKCECNRTGVLFKGWEDTYDKETELPFVNHKPNECKCTNNLKQYWKNGKKVWLCSCCVMDETEVKYWEQEKNGEC